MIKRKSITSNTKKFGIIGYPLGHSYSPIMHNAAFDALSYDGIYLPFPVKNLVNLRYSLKQLDIRGVSVTIPYKIRIRRIANQLDPLAIEIGSVNTLIRNNNGLFQGYNTDGSGAIRAIGETGLEIKKKNVLIIGSGGSARAIAFSLLKEKPAKLAVMARNEKTALSLLKNLALQKKHPVLEFFKVQYSSSQKNKILKKRPTRKISIHNLTDPEQIADYDIVIQTTPLGMKGSYENQSPISADFINSRMVLFDIIYNPRDTLLVKMAKKKKVSIIPGYKMLLHQGVLQFKLFTGVDAPTLVMEKTLLNAIRHKI